MKRLALRALRRIQRLPELLKSFFPQPECQPQPDSTHYGKLVEDMADSVFELQQVAHRALVGRHYQLGVCP